MNYQEIVDFIEQNPVCTIATATNNQPHLRAFLTNIIDNTLYFTTSLEKNVGKEILQNQKSELCYLKQDFSKMLRITTTLKIVDEKKIKEFDHVDINNTIESSSKLITSIATAAVELFSVISKSAKRKV